MDIYEIPLQNNTPNFEITTVINDENLKIKIRSLNNKTYMDLTCNNTVIFQGLMCDANTSLTASFKYKGIKGDLMFFSETGGSVFYTGFGSEFILYYKADN